MVWCFVLNFGIFDPMKRLSGILLVGFMFTAMVFTASNHPPIEKHDKIVIVDDFTPLSVSDVVLVSEINFVSLKGTDSPNWDAVLVDMYVEYLTVSQVPEYRWPGKLKNKYHAPWLFEPVKIC